MKICVYAICKNEMKFVDKWLDSMQEADYICVLDTGSTDGTYKKLKDDSRVTAVKKESIKPWRFDVARNESMKLVPEDADVLVCTDLDEVFEPGWSDVIRANWNPGTNRMFYSYAWSHNALGEPQDVFKYDKIHSKDYHWVYPVHEVLAINEGAIQNAVDVGDSIFLHHWPDKSKPRGYYMDLLKLSCKEHPSDCHVQMLYARELLIQDRWEEGLTEFLKTLKMPDIENPDKRLVLLNSLFQVAEIYQKLQNYDEALWYCQEFIKEDHTYREPYLLMAELYNQMKMPTLAYSCVEAAEKFAFRHNDWVERATTWLGWIHDVKSVSEDMLGLVDAALEDLSKALAHDPDDARLLKNENILLKKKLSQHAIKPQANGIADINDISIVE